MLGLLASAGKSLLSNVLPSAINWGVNKLMTTNFGKSVLSRPLMDKISHVANIAKRAIPKQKSQASEAEEPVQVQQQWQQQEQIPPQKKMKRGKPIQKKKYKGRYK